MCHSFISEVSSIRSKKRKVKTCFGATPLERDRNDSQHRESDARSSFTHLNKRVNQRQLKGSLIATLSEAYLGHFELAATKFSTPGKAYQVIEQARGRSLADTLRGELESLSAGNETSLDAQREINRIQLALLHETNREGRQSLLDELFRVEQFLSPARRKISLLNAGTDRLKPIPLETLQGSISPNEMLLEYVLGDTQSYCLRITRGATSIVILRAGRKAVEDLVDDYLEAVRSRKPESESAKQLFSVLLDPAVRQQPQTRLIVVPDGKLNLLPFDALRNSEGSYVLETHVVTYAPSATVFYLLREHRSSNRLTRNFLGVGGVVYSSSTASSGSAGSIAPKGNMVADFFGLDAVTFPDPPGSCRRRRDDPRIESSPPRQRCHRRRV